MLPPPAINASRFFLSLAILFMLRLPAVIAPLFLLSGIATCATLFCVSVLIGRAFVYAGMFLMNQVILPCQCIHSCYFTFFVYPLGLYDDDSDLPSGTLISSPFSKLIGIDEFLAQLCVVRKVIGSVVTLCCLHSS
jgi:hypothetical protein